MENSANYLRGVSTGSAEAFHGFLAEETQTSPDILC